MTGALVGLLALAAAAPAHADGLGGALPTQPLTQTVQATTSTIVAPAVQTVQTATAPVTQTATTAVAPVTKVTSNTTAPVVQTAEKTAAPVVQTVEKTAAPVVQAAAPVVRTVEKTAAPVVQAAAPVVRTVEKAAAPVAETAQRTVAPVTETVTKTAAPATEAAAPVTRTVTDPIAPTAAPLPVDSVAPVPRETGDVVRTMPAGPSGDLTGMPDTATPTSPAGAAAPSPLAPSVSALTVPSGISPGVAATARDAGSPTAAHSSTSPVSGAPAPPPAGWLVTTVALNASAVTAREAGPRIVPGNAPTPWLPGAPRVPAFGSTAAGGASTALVLLMSLLVPFSLVAPRLGRRLRPPGDLLRPPALSLLLDRPG